MDLHGQTALVTGGARRIGAAIAAALAGAGVRVVVHHHRSGADAEPLVARLRAAGAEAWALSADLQSDADVAELVPRAIRLAGPVDFLINNAAVFHKDRFSALDAGRLRGEFQVNFFAPLLLMEAFRRQDRPGVILNLLDRRICGLDPSAVPYVLSKKALAEATLLAAAAFAPRIRVNGLAPGAALPPAGEDERSMREAAGPIPLGRSGGPEDLARAALFLLREDTVTGQILYVDGGQHLVQPTGDPPRDTTPLPQPRETP